MTKPDEFQLESKTVTVRVGLRLFRVHSYLGGTKLHRGTVTPIVIHFRKPNPFDASMLGFKVYDDDAMQGPLAIVQTISVVKRLHRRGWASDMVKALMILYPTKVWEVESPNGKSFALFESLHTAYPDRVKTPVLHE